MYHVGVKVKMGFNITPTLSVSPINAPPIVYIIIIMLC